MFDQHKRVTALVYRKSRNFHCWNIFVNTTKYYLHWINNQTWHLQPGETWTAAVRTRGCTYPIASEYQHVHALVCLRASAMSRSDSHSQINTSPCSCLPYFSVHVVFADTTASSSSISIGGILLSQAPWTSTPGLLTGSSSRSSSYSAGTRYTC